MDFQSSIQPMGFQPIVFEFLYKPLKVSQHILWHVAMTRVWCQFTGIKKGPTVETVPRFNPYSMKTDCKVRNKFY
jgi:hypothetical protein